MPTRTFPKSEHLCLRAEIDKLFTSGSVSASVFPIRGVFRLTPLSDEPRVKVLISVSKRHFHHATDRNTIKRRMREAYRLHKADFIGNLPDGIGLHVGFLWLSDTMTDFPKIEESVRTLLNIIADKATLAQRTNPIEL